MRRGNGTIVWLPVPRGAGRACTRAVPGLLARCAAAIGDFHHPGTARTRSKGVDASVMQ
jgi:hypothetical protein